jgi:hypothetical protein
MQMSLRNGHIGLAVALAMMVAGGFVIGRDPSDAQMHAVVWPAFFVGIAVMLVLESREERRQRRRSSDRD